MPFNQTLYDQLVNAGIDKRQAKAIADTRVTLATGQGLTGSKPTISNSAAADVATLRTDFNALLTALRNRGVIN